MHSNPEQNSRAQIAAIGGSVQQSFSARHFRDER
jgi:hypothetical protein